MLPLLGNEYRESGLLCKYKQSVLRRCWFDESNEHCLHFIRKQLPHRQDLLLEILTFTYTWQAYRICCELSVHLFDEGQVKGNRSIQHKFSKKQNQQMSSPIQRGTPLRRRLGYITTKPKPKSCLQNFWNFIFAIYLSKILNPCKVIS